MVNYINNIVIMMVRESWFDWYYKFRNWKIWVIRRRKDWWMRWSPKLGQVV